MKTLIGLLILSACSNNEPSFKYRELVEVAKQLKAKNDSK